MLSVKIILQIISLVLAFGDDGCKNKDAEAGKKTSIWTRWKFWKRVGLIAIFICACIIYVGEHNNEKQSKAESVKQQEKHDEESRWLREKLNFSEAEVLAARSELSTVREDLHSANELIAEQSRQMAEQSRRIGSLVYNIETSFGGKLRFAKCFRGLSELSKTDHYEPLICDEGVAVYRFEPITYVLKGFFFFANSDVNKVLSGDPMNPGNGTETNIVFKQESEMARALSIMKERKTPIWQDAPVANRMTLHEIAELLETFCRYVLRAEQFATDSIYPPGWKIDFSYAVDPFAKKVHMRHCTVFWNEGFIRSLHDVTHEEFMRKVLARFRADRVPPQIRVSDVRELNRMQWRAEAAGQFPYNINGQVNTSKKVPLPPWSKFEPIWMQSNSMNLKRDGIEEGFVVGYNLEVLEKGRNHIRATTTFAGLFPTMQNAYKYDPIDGLIGDDIIFDLDGQTQTYRFLPMTNGVLQLAAVNGKKLPTITLDAIPLLDSFCIDHRNDSKVSILKSGHLTGISFKEDGDVSIQYESPEK